MAKIISFGDSFLLGNELEREDGSCAWPGLIAERLKCDFDVRASAGCGNDYIAQQIFDYFDPDQSYKDTLVVINWTWSMRWDFYINSQSTWIGLGPTCVPEKITGLVDDHEAEKLIMFYQKYLESSDPWNKLRSLLSVYSTQKFLTSLGIPSVQTYMDKQLWYPKFPLLEYVKKIKDPSWPDVEDEAAIADLDPIIQKEIRDGYANIEPSYVQTLRNLTKKQLSSFNGLTFLEWSEYNGFRITPTLHPLQEAHDAAADFWQPVYQDMLAL